MKIDVGIAANKNQEQKWWSTLMPELLALERRGKVEVERFIVIGSALTDYNRNKVVATFLDGGDSEALWFIDDDTIPPPRAVEWLVDLLETGACEVAAGIYYSRSAPFNPIAYQRRPNGLYIPLARFEPGEIVYVDSVGMGCTLIRERVFTTIQEQYRVYSRVSNGTLVPVHREDMREGDPLQPGVVMGPGEVRGYVVEPIAGPVDVEEWPFYAFEHGRTEDHFFCEMALRCGFRIAVDTAVECQHVGMEPTTRQRFQDVKDTLGSYAAVRVEMGDDGRRMTADGGESEG